MATNQKADTPGQVEKTAATYTRDQVLQSAKYRQYRDIAGVVLEEEKLYTAEDIQKRIDEFLKMPIKEELNKRG